MPLFALCATKFTVIRPAHAHPVVKEVYSSTFGTATGFNRNGSAADEQGFSIEIDAAIA